MLTGKNFRFFLEQGTKIDVWSFFVHPGKSKLKRLRPGHCLVFRVKNPQLKILYLRGNKLKTLPGELIRHKGLDVLDMGFNRLEKVPEVLALMPQIRILDMQHNALDSFDIPLTDIFKLQLLDPG